MNISSISALWQIHAPRLFLFAQTLLFFLLSRRTASPERSASSSSPTGPSKGCQKPGRASSISSDKCTKPRNSSDRMDQSLYTAGREEAEAHIDYKIKSKRRGRMDSSCSSARYFNSALIGLSGFLNWVLYRSPMQNVPNFQDYVGGRRRILESPPLFFPLNCLLCGKNHCRCHFNHLKILLPGLGGQHSLNTSRDSFIWI